MIRKTIKGGDFKSQMVGELVFDQVPEEGSFNPVTSDAVAKIAGGVADLDAIVPEGASEENKLATAADVAGVQEDVDTIEGKIPSDTSTTNKLVNESGLQDAIDNASESWSTGFTPKGESSVSDLNDLATQSNGDSYIVTDSGTLTDGSLAVVAGDQVAWDATNSVWYKLPQYALKQFGTNAINNLPTTITSFRTGDVIAVDGPSGAAKMPKDALLELTAQNALDSIHSLNDTATEDDLVSGNYLALNGIIGTKRLRTQDVAKRSVQVIDDEKLKIALANTQAIEAMSTLKCRLANRDSDVIWDFTEPQGHYGCIISVHSGDVVSIRPTTACSVAFLKSLENIGFEGSTADVSSAAGFGSVTTITTAQTYTIPSDVNYFYFTTILNHVSYVPTISVNGVSINDGSLSSLGRLVPKGVYKDTYNDLVVQNNAQTLIWSPVLTTATDLQQFMDADLSDTGGDYLAMVQQSNDGTNFLAPDSLTWSASIKGFWSRISQTYFRIIVKRNDGGVLSNGDIWVKDVEGSVSVAIPRMDFGLGKNRTNWKGKKWVAFGCSISDSGPNGNAGVIPPTGLYPKYLTALSGLKHKNWAYGGSSWTYNDGMHPTYLERLTAAITAGDVATADIITVDGCVNDFSHGSPIGEKTDSVTTTICGAINNFVSAVRAVNQQALIVFIADSTGKEYNGISECVYTTTKNVVDGGETHQYTQSDYIAAMKKMADYIGVKFVNAGPNSGINKFTPDYIKDHIHHTEKGGQQFANAIWSELQTIQPSVV